MTLDSGTMILIAVVMGIYFIGMIVISCMGRKYGKTLMTLLVRVGTAQP